MQEIEAGWANDWLWGLPLIMVTLVTHVVGLATISERVVRLPSETVDRRRFLGVFALVIGAVALLATVLHALEGAIWAAAYLILGALPDLRTAMLYSLSAMTSYGHANIVLENTWQMMGAL